MPRAERDANRNPLARSDSSAALEMDGTRRTIIRLRMDGARKPITRLQRKFNNLIERLNAQRGELARWQAYRHVYQQRLAERYHPLAVCLREKRVALAGLFDRALERAALSKRDREKLQVLLIRSLGELLAEARDAELIRLHDKYAAVSFEEGQRVEMEALRAMAGEEFGVDVDAYPGEDSPQELADWLKTQIRGARREGDQKTPAKARLREHAAEGGTRAVREVFRKLVSELHPDRETDSNEQARKTELMQRVNLAYKSGDLLGLLELQLSIEQIDSDAIAGLAEERLQHYIYVLEEQSKGLRDELSELLAPFVEVVGDSMSRSITPDAVQRMLEADIRALKDLVQSTEAELVRFRDVRQLRSSLSQYRINAL